MELNGFVQNGVIVLSGGATLPEGIPVIVSCGVETAMQPSEKKRAQLPLVRSATPGTMDLNNNRIAEIFTEEEVHPYFNVIIPGPHDAQR